jgi:hypothetical protein
LAGNLTFYDVDGGQTFEVVVANSFAGTSGGFAGADFATGTNTIGTNPTTSPKTQGLSTSNLIRMSVDGSDPITVSLPDRLRGAELTGTELAAELTKAINNAFSDEQFINISAANGNNAFRLQAEIENANSSLSAQIQTSMENGITITLADNAQYTPDTLVAEVQSKIDTAIGSGVLRVGYDARSRTLTFKPFSNSDRIQTLKLQGPNSNGVDTANETLGLGATSDFVSVGASTLQGTFSTGEVRPNGEFRLNEDQRRFGIEVQYLKDQRKFVFSSGTTGESSSIQIFSTADNTRASFVLGLADEFAQEIQNLQGTGLPAKPAVTRGGKAGIDISGTFSVTPNDNVVNVTVDGIDGSISIPPGAYTGLTFAAALEQRIN